MGNRPIAEYLISKGGRPSLFSSTMLGHLDVVKAFVAAQPGVQRIRGPHSISLLAHAKAGGPASRPASIFCNRSEMLTQIRLSRSLTAKQKVFGVVMSSGPR